MIDDFMHILSWQQNMKNINNEQKNTHKKILKVVNYFNRFYNSFID